MGPGPQRAGLPAPRPQPAPSTPTLWRRRAGGRCREVAWHLPRMLSGLDRWARADPRTDPPVLVIPGSSALTGRRWTAPGAGARRLAGAPWLLGINMGERRNAEPTVQPAQGPRGPAQGAGRRLEPGRHVRAAACAPRARQSARGRDLGLALFRRPQDQHQRPRNLRTGRGPRRQPAAVRWRFGQAAGADPGPCGAPRRDCPQRAPRPGAARSTRRSRSTPTIWASRSTARRSAGWVAEIRTFLTEVEGKPPELHPMAGRPGFPRRESSRIPSLPSRSLDSSAEFAGKRTKVEQMRCESCGCGELSLVAGGGIRTYR